MNSPTNEELLRSCLAGELPPEWSHLLEREADLTGPERDLALRLAETQRFVALLGELPGEPIPRHVQKATRSIAHGSSRLKVWLASLWVPKESPGQLRPAFRGAAAAPATYEAGPFELDVLRSATGALVGELLATDDERLAGGTCTLFGQELVRSTMLTEHGHFRFEDVPPGTYRLVLELEGQGSIVVSDLSL